MFQNNDSQDYSPTQLDYCSWIEMGWWTPNEAWLVLLGLPPQAAADFTFCERAFSLTNGKKIKDLINRAIVDSQIKGLEREGGSFSGYYRAPCKSWIDWAKTKKTISICPELLRAVSEEVTMQTHIDGNAKIFNERNYHPSVSKHAQKPFAEGNHTSAVFETAKAFEKAVQNKSQNSVFGEKLMSQAFSLKGPLKINDHSTETKRNEQEGVMYIAMGTIKAIKNPLSHETVIDRSISENDAFDSLAIFSFLWKQLEKAEYKAEE